MADDPLIYDQDADDGAFSRDEPTPAAHVPANRRSASRSSSSGPDVRSSSSRGRGGRRGRDSSRSSRPPAAPGDRSTEDARPRSRDRSRLPDGFRSSRRSTRGGKANRRDVARFRMRLKAMSAGQQALVVGAGLVGGVLVAALVLWGVATGINELSRWYIRSTAGSVAEARRRELARDNVLIVGVRDGKAGGFLAARIETKTPRRIFGIAIPEGAFVEVPGQGFERIGDSYSSGADTAKAAVSNYLSVPFERYIAVPYEAYQTALRSQSLAGITNQVLATDIPGQELKVLGATADSIPSKNVAFVPLPVRPITVGDQRYFQPQRQQVAEILQSWWGVKVGPESRIRVIVQNGAGSPGIAGAAAKVLIGAGYQVVYTKNAPSFGREQTLILLYKGPTSNAEHVRDLLKVGVVKKVVSDQNLADIIVIIGRDYVAPK